MRSIGIMVIAFGVLLALGLYSFAQSQQKDADTKNEATAKTSEGSVEAVQPEPDASVIVHENALNGLLAAIGSVSGKGKYDVAGSRGDYTWTVRKPRIEITPAKAQFTADAAVKIGPMSYTSPAKGTVAVKYDDETNRISVKVVKANFDVYVKVFGNKFNISKVDISKYYSPEFEFAGPQPLQESVSVDLPGGKTKTLQIDTEERVMRLEQDRIVVTSNLVFSEKPAADAQQADAPGGDEAEGGGTGE